MNVATLVIDIQSYWHPGTGRGSGFHLDAVVHTGPDGLPRLPGRTLKGLLRDAVHRAEQWGWSNTPSGSTEALFGTLGRDGQPTRPGLLRVSDATLPDGVAAYLATEAGKPLIPGLYREHFSTAINADTGVAASRSLRGMQVVVPVMLEALVTEIPGIVAVPDWQTCLAGVFPLVTAVGAQRTRGFGRAHLSWKKEG